MIINDEDDDDDDDVDKSDWMLIRVRMIDNIDDCR